MVDPVHLAGQPAPGRGGVVQPARGQPPVVVAALLTALGLAVADDDQESRRAVHAHIVPCAAATSTLAPVPLRPVSPVPAGTLCVIGGAEDRTGSRVVLREFVRLAGGDGCRIAVVATASSLGQEILDEYDVVFRELGAGDVLRLRPESRTDADDPALAARLGDVDAVFMTGGNQLKLTQVVGGTAVRRGGAGGVPARRPGRRHLGGRQRRQRAHDRLRRRVGHPAAGGDARRPPGSACCRTSSSTSTSRSGTATAGCCRWSRARRGCSGSASTRTPRPSSAAGTCSRWSARLRVRGRRVVRGERRAHGRARRAAAGVRRRRAHAAGRGPVRPDHPPSGRLPRGAPRPPDRQPPPGGRRHDERPARTSRSCRRGSTGGRTCGRTSRPSTSSSTSARWRTTPPTPSPASSTGCSRRCPAWPGTRAPAATAAASWSG